MKFNGREIDIYSAPITYGIAHFYDNDKLYEDDSGKVWRRINATVQCEVCDAEWLSPTYVYIIGVLREANLLPEGYKLMCCRCYNKLYPEMATEEWKEMIGED